MSEWPDRMRVGPIREWPGALTPASQRRRAPFKAAVWDSYTRRSVELSSTLELLERELRMLGAREVELLVAIDPKDFRLDGKPRAQAKAAHPGVILSFSASVGQLSYPCDTFTTWQDNLRAIALALEALRKVDRYAVTKRGEQYRGFLAIEARPAAGVVSVQQARSVLFEAAGGSGDGEPLGAVARRAQRMAHPDTGGDAETFQRVTEAIGFLEQAGEL
jgi:hypothetical protein